MIRKRGDTYSSRWRLTANGAPADLTGYTSVVLIARSKSTGALLLNRVPVVIEDAVNGVVRYDWQPADVSATTNCSYEFEALGPDAKPRTFPNEKARNPELVISADLG